MKLWLTIFLLPLATYAQTETARLLTSAEMHEDIRVAKSSLEEAYPGLYKIVSRQSLDYYFKKLEAESAQPHTVFWLHQQLAAVTARIQEGHVRVLLPDKTSNALYQAPKIHIPITFRILDGKFYLYRSFSDEIVVETGSYVTQFNGVSADTLMKTMTLQMSSDEDNIGHKYKRIEAQQREFIPVQLQFPAAYSMDIVNASGDVKHVSVPAATYPEIRAIASKKFPQNTGPLNYFKINAEGIGILRLENFFKDKKFDFKAFLSKTFADIQARHVTNLIIDLRDNRGGRDEYAALLLSHLYADPFEYYSSRTINHKKFKCLKYSNERILNLALKFYKKDKNADGTYALKTKWDKQFMKPNPNAYKGKTYILANGGTFSTGASFVHNAWLHKIASFIGEPVGGSAKGGGGAAVSIILPNSKVIIAVPMIELVLPTARHYPGNGIFTPEHNVKTSIKDLIEERDPQMEKAKALIGVSKTP